MRFKVGQLVYEMYVSSPATCKILEINGMRMTVQVYHHSDDTWYHAYVWADAMVPLKNKYSCGERVLLKSGGTITLKMPRHIYPDTIRYGAWIESDILCKWCQS